MDLNPKKFGLAFGLLWGTGLAIITILALIIPPYGKSFLESMVSVYPWYTISWPGVAIGFIDGFLDGFIGGVIFAWIYNHCGCCKSCENKK